MTLAVMTRATLGHTGRALKASRGTAGDLLLCANRRPDARARRANAGLDVRSPACCRVHLDWRIWRASASFMDRCSCGHACLGSLRL